MEEVKIETYDDVKQYLLTKNDGKFKDFIIEKDDIRILYAYTIFDCEHKDKNKTLNAIAMCNNLGEDYVKVCKYLVSNTEYFPGLLEAYPRLFIYIPRLKYALMLSHNKDFLVLFEVTENKEDGELIARTLKYSSIEMIAKNIYIATDNYIGMDNIKKEFESNVNMYLKKIKEATTICSKV